VVKIVDFGVAKATLHEGHTRGGIKGKMSYLAPEQLYDQPVDGRTDVFQLGICLHELLTGQRLFKGDSDQQRAVAVLERPIPPPSDIVPTLPPVLDEVVMWSLQRDPNRRPASADEFRRALEGAAGKIGSFSGHDLGGWMKSTFADRLAERTQFERQCVAEMREGRSASSDKLAASRETGPRPGGLRVAGPLPAAAESQEGMAAVQPLAVRGRIPSLSPPPTGSDSRPAYHGYSPHGISQSPPPATESPGWKMAGLVGVGILMLAGVAVAWTMGGSSSETATAQPPSAAPATSPAPPAEQPTATSSTPSSDPAASAGSFEVEVTVIPARASIVLDGVEVGRGSYRATLPRDGTRHIMSVQADGYEEVGLEFTDQPPASRVELDPVRGQAERRASPRPARRLQTGPAAGKKAVRTRVPDAEPDESLTDNPDPWAADPNRGEGRSEESR
jgi:serine/threonine protein kinase